MSLLCVLVACAPDDVAVPLEDPQFQGETQPDSDAVETVPSSGLSECSLLEENSCGEGRACVPRSSGIRACVDHAVLELGESCANGTLQCVSGTLCFRDEQGDRCVQTCDLEQSACGDRRCVPWLDVDGERAGRCGPAL